MLFRSGMLYSTGLVAGGSLTGVAIALLSGLHLTSMVNGQSKEISYMQYVADMVGIHGFENMGATADLIGAVMFGLLGVLLVRTALKKV